MEFEGVDKQSLLAARRRQWAEKRQLDSDAKELREQDGLKSEAKLLGELTSRISRRVQQEVARDMKLLNREQQVNLAEKMESYLSSELHQSHACQICFEPMLPPERAPMLLFPCGHTFCSQCMRRQQSSSSSAKNNCALCRRPIQSTAENHSLRQLIERFVQQKESLQKGNADDIDALFPSHVSGSEGEAHDGGRRASQQDYKADFENYSMRHKILSDSLNDIRENLRSLLKRKESNEIAKQKLLQERQRICEELALLDEHLEAKSSKIEELREMADDEKQKELVVEQTLASLRTDMEKAKLLSGAR